ncbi:hypothetical protein H3H54_13275 [Brachybacterium sp. Z12]|uniref:hypothetical protein n=1 Tax=Brachybacterium sp. Z12 TaxID=2759167 RepID=UPI001860544F|nr:hypothetical protein [Brachybacterium sp. Z12]QNN82124.1 hypothetical protein H3H54_13275 [Brachybacterium sp. Z12]
MAEPEPGISDIPSWRRHHAAARAHYDAVARSVTDADAPTPSGTWTAAEVLAHVSEGHDAADGEMVDHLVQLQMLTLDLAVHTWDLSRSQGLEPATDENLHRALHAAFAPHTALMAQEDAFAPPVPVGPGAAPLERLVGLCGRDPAWSRP